MNYVRLGGTGVKVSPLCLGAMMFGSWGNPDHDESVRTIHTALGAGINFIDTANVYSAGESEEIVGKPLKGEILDSIDQIVAPGETLNRADAGWDPPGWERNTGAPGAGGD